MARPADERIRVTYRLTLAEGEAAEAKAREIALEQTVELPDGCYPPKIEERSVGRVESLEECGPSRWKATLSYTPELVGAEVPQLLNLFFGNISMKRGILVTAVDLPTTLLRQLPGPQFGVAGVRSACGSEKRPLLMSAAKPIGLSPKELAAICGALTRGGMDIIKDDHGVANQAPAPFCERVEQCQEAVSKANSETGGCTLYFPNISGPLPGVRERAEFAGGAGCRGVVVSPFLVGLDVIRWLAESTDLIIFSHPALAGTYFHPDHGIAPEVLLGNILRLLGSDGVIYVNAGGRFPVTEETCQAINANLRRPLQAIRPAFPVAGGGVDVKRIPYWVERYGVDTAFLIGSTLYAQSGLEEATRRLSDEVRRHCNA